MTRHKGQKAKRGQATLEDLTELRDIHRQIQRLGEGLDPISPAHHAYMSLLWSVRGCLLYWSGEHPDLWTPPPT